LRFQVKEQDVIKDDTLLEGSFKYDFKPVDELREVVSQDGKVVVKVRVQVILNNEW
jgi:hypothetical protein